MNTQRKNTQGFTLVELLTGIAIAAILLGSAGPNFFEFVQSSRSATEYRSLLSGLQLARSEAITRGVSVTVSASNGADWHDGFRVWADEDGDGTYDAGEEIMEISKFESAATMTESNNTTAFTYTAEGFLDAVAGTSFMLSYRTSKQCKWDRDISLVYTGHVSARERACTE
ncbi:GspH/FimT family pseudopilin [Litorivivens sp.]|uniref:GspH/FimT family pseudopilin n=1 Tax=Litorivivens sp. TaxID=2020868 RepID=UPI0035648532